MAQLGLLVERGLWSIDFAARVLTFALAAGEDVDIIQEAAGQLAARALGNAVAQNVERRGPAASRGGDAPFPACAGDQRLAADLRATSHEPLWFAHLDQGVTRWDLNTAWVGGEDFWPALFLHHHDRFVRFEGDGSLHMSGLWVESVSGKASARAGVVLHLPALPAGSLRLRLFYRTEGLGETSALLRVTRLNVIVERWPLYPTSEDCWSALEIPFQSVPDPNTDVTVLLTTVGDLWVDAISIRQAAP